MYDTGWVAPHPWIFQQIQLATPNKNERVQLKKSTILVSDDTTNGSINQVLTKSSIPLHDDADGVDKAEGSFLTAKSNIPATGKTVHSENTTSLDTLKSNISLDNLTEEDLKTIMPLLSPTSKHAEKNLVKSGVSKTTIRNNNTMRKSTNLGTTNLSHQQQTNSDFETMSFKQSSTSDINNVRPPAIPVRTKIPMTSRFYTRPSQTNNKYQVAGTRSRVIQRPGYYYSPSAIQMSPLRPQNIPRSAVPVPIIPLYQHQSPRGNIQARLQAYPQYHNAARSWPGVKQQTVMYRALNHNIPYYHSNKRPFYAKQVRAAQQPGFYYYRTNTFPSHRV